jgi:sugar/nucleoside kinase (ribokinase family)
MSAGVISVIGTVSTDTLHLTNGQTVHTFGGAGLYTALAVNKAGGACDLFAPKPHPMPDELAKITKGIRWYGPEVTPDQLPRLEIQHHGHGSATLLDASWGAEQALLPTQLPPITPNTGMAHVAALSSAGRQLAFLHHLSSKGAKVSVGTYARLVYGSTPLVKQIFEQADIFFMNQNEAEGLFGTTDNYHTKGGALLFITLDAEGVLVFEGSKVTYVAGTPVAELDATGAGDTFCGATLAGLTAGLSPVEAANIAVKLAAQTVAAIGPSALAT